MDYKVIWTDEALSDVEEIAEFIEKDSHFYASVVVTNIINATRNLESYHNSGSIVPEEGNKFLRENIIYNYRLIYEIIETSIYVLAVVHGRRLLNPVIKDRIKN
ncbi:MAG: type II toxin-antitoxin system RelE/ParE family toxin [Candidatus Delongbacteria bacterium]|nr:type II toxin-antitoxin system RelE/ParE family toxin [Candidatus Delongbacteria bacterium]